MTSNVWERIYAWLEAAIESVSANVERGIRVLERWAIGLDTDRTSTDVNSPDTDLGSSERLPNPLRHWRWE
jgi:hypothetical protein